MTATSPPLRQVLAGGQRAALHGEYASDHWDALRLGVPARRGLRARAAAAQCATCAAVPVS